MIDLVLLERDREEACIDKADLFDFYNSNWDNLVAEIVRLRSGTPAQEPAKAWVMTEIWDDSDPGDKASLSKVQVFTTLEDARAAFLEKHKDLKVDADVDDLHLDFGDDVEEDPGTVEWLEAIYGLCRQEPERFTWVSGDNEDGWNGGYIVEITEVETKP